VIEYVYINGAKSTFFKFQAKAKDICKIDILEVTFISWKSSTLKRSIHVTIEWIKYFVRTPSSKETALQFGADPTMHPHSEWRSPSVHPEITAQEARSANACFLSASSLSSVPQRLDTPLRRTLRHARVTTDLSKWILSRPHSTARAYGPPRPRGTRRFLAATSKRWLAYQLEKVGPSLAVR